MEPEGLDDPLTGLFLTFCGLGASLDAIATLKTRHRIKQTQNVSKPIIFHVDVTIVLPVTLADLTAVEALSSGGAFEEFESCGVSDRGVELDGTNTARSGGWSFPTEGFACKETHKSILCKFFRYSFECYILIEEFIIFTSKSTYDGSLPIDTRNLSRPDELSA